MKFIIYSKMVLPVCESCLEGEHLSYGDNHTTGEQGRRDCKYTESNSQCVCNPDWTEFYELIENKDNLSMFNSKTEAESKLKEILEEGIK